MTVRQDGAMTFCTMGKVDFIDGGHANPRWTITNTGAMNLINERQKTRFSRCAHVIA